MDLSYAERYRDLYARHWWWRARRKLIVRELSRLCPPGGWRRILDVGCGDGLFFPELESFARSVEGVEPDPNMLGPSPRYASRIHAGPFEAFHPEARYSLILLLDVVEHVTDAEAFLRRAVELLESDGILLITVPAFPLLWTSHDVVNHHVARYTAATFRALAGRAGVRIERARYFFHWLFFAKLAARLYELVARPVPKPPAVPSPFVNRAAYLLSRADEVGLGQLPLPLGSSLLILGRAVPRPVGDP